MTLLDGPPRATGGPLLDPPGEPAGPADSRVARDAPDAAARVALRVRDLCTAWQLPATAPLAQVWRRFAALGREDLAVARLTEGHVDATRILAQADREPLPARDGGPAVYGVWASASGGTGLTGTPEPGGLRLDGMLRYCSGAWFLDRALVVARTPDGLQLLDVDVRGPALRRDDATWPAVGMDVTRSVDVHVDGLCTGSGDQVGAPGFYLDRPGFAAGGAGVAAVWLGGAAGVLDALVTGLAAKADPHQRAHLGAMAAALVAADATLGELAAREGDPAPISAADALAARSAVDAAVGEVLRRAPRVSGPTPLCRDAAFAHRIADLEVYVRQHHAEADLERLGSGLLADGTLLGRRFGGSA